MYYLFEKQDRLNDPIECFYFDSAKELFPVRPHWHYFAEIIFMLRGSAEMVCDGENHTVSEGDLMVFPPSSVHSIYSAEGFAPMYAVLKFDLSLFPSYSSYAPSLTNIFRFARSEHMKVHFKGQDIGSLDCERVFRECIEEKNSYRYGYDVILRSLIYRLLFSLVRLWIDEGLDIDKCPAEADMTYGIENITEYIDSHLEDNIRVSDIADKCHMSYSCFAAKFREQYGMTCKEYIEKMRIFKAEEYLLFTVHDLNYISLQTGFSDCSHFIRSFKKYRGVTPKQFRLQRKRRK